MYAALWHALPGPVWVRLLLVLVLIALVLAACFYFVFPWVNSLQTTPDVTVEQ
jgi:hypothetical protein